MKHILKYLLLTLFTGLTLHVNGTHNRAGEITYVQTGPLTIMMTATTYTKTSSLQADRDSIEVFWGDGTSEFIQRTNGKGTPLGNDVKLNTYSKEHTYPGRATYTIGFADPNRVANILNVNYPNSVEVEFFLSTTFTFLDPQFQGTNSSAILLQPPIDIACANKVFIHNPNAYDPDGDSLSYELVVPKMSATNEVPGYLFPDEVSPGPLNQITLDPTTGDFVWNTPRQQGEYNIAIKVNEWRRGVLLNSIIRDMQILVSACNNDPPIIDVIQEICVVAGEEINLPIVVNDPNSGDKVGLFASGGPFIVDKDKATIENNNGFEEPEFTSNFVWQTNCNHISDRYYQVVLRAVDDFFTDSTGLATLKTVRIKVVGPQPENLTAESEDGGIRLFWDSPYDCEVTDSSFFQGFSVWRKTGSTSFPLDTCDPGLTNSPYTKIIFQTKNKIDDRYSTVDVNVEKGITYCYRVVAEFAQISAAGNPYNRIESLRSNEVCQQLTRDIPLLTKVSIQNTSNTNGAVHIRWTKPLPDDLDTTINLPPYTYELYRSIDDGLSFDVIPDFTITTATFSEEIDTNYFDLNQNTVDIQPQYFIKFYSNNNDYGDSPSVSSTYLTVAPTDERQELTWNEFVPWTKVSYNIYYTEPGSSTFNFLGSSELPSYTHSGLVNGLEYCYYIEAIGSYSISNIEDPLINLSQEVCSIPYDNIPPCPPRLEVENLCDNESPIDLDELINTLAYTRPNVDCNETDDVLGYYIYFNDIEGQTLVRIDSIFDESVNRYEHFPTRGISGCYAVSAFDMNGNESELSNIVCVDNCPAYQLPNTFTPNSDGANELFVPIVNRFIEAVDFQVYNKWGNQVFESNNPLILWDGTTNNGKEVPDGTYYYTCSIIEQRVTGNVEGNVLLKGHINIIR